MKEQALRQLVEDLSKGDEKAFGKLYQLFGEKVYHIARKMNLCHEDAEGVVQEVFLKIWKKRANLDPELSINAYMIAIVRSLVIKKSKKEARFFAYQKYKIPLISFETNSDPELDLIYSDFHQVSSALIEKLPPGQKQVFILKNFENLSTDEIAEKLNLSKRTVENQIFRASKGIKDKLQKLKIISASIFLLMIDAIF
ncbi:sigma-70 family RNA polymerase sigma factor [Belliella sp. DSM 111904]|uniref:Sigma-70 family RNA polymerase sigma factor n=1 Tax=Belliella filtrata TaxID=2923435 RepID=A0ABS9UYF6_9BACT|nr:sigma-70 family RNA polymerase sigma factor [Belliella filtrata]MCH7409184.1 sigma-70 family RNA polymerase sigma factor [Belliella filtrata]